MLSTTLSPLVEKLSTLLSVHPAAPVLVALDGRCGSGKTTLAAQLARQFPQSITVHTDDFYLPPASRVANWEQIPCANMDLERLRAQVLTPARAGQAIPYHAYSCRRVPTCRNNALRPSRWSSWRAVTAATPPLRTVMI